MLLRLPYLALTTVFALVRLVPMSESDKNVEILTLRHQLAILQRQIENPASPRPTGRSSPPCSTDSPAPDCASST